MFIFYLDTTYHCKAYDQFHFDIISHIQNDKLISSIIPNLFKINKRNFLNEHSGSNKTDIQNNFEKIVREKDFALLSIDQYISDTKPILTCHIYSIMNTMKDWCRKNQREENSKGFAIYAYSQILKLSESSLKNFLYKTTCEDSHETVIVYNPSKKVIFLIRMAIEKDLEDDIKLSANDMMKFVLTFFDVLGKSGVRLINLLVTGEEPINYQSKCGSCKHQIISIDSFISSKSFDGWWEKKENRFNISVIHKDLNKNFSSVFFSRLVGLVDSWQLNYAIKQLLEARVLTPEQTRIVYLPRTQLLIKGCNQSAKTIVACKKAEIISRSLTEDDSIYIICDSRSILKEEMHQNSKINMFHNLNQEPESEILEQILRNNSKKGKLNLIFDELFCENLQQAEAKKLNQAFKTNPRLKDSNVILIAQPLQTESVVRYTRKKENIFEILETVNPSEELNFNNRNNMSISKNVNVKRETFQLVHTVAKEEIIEHKVNSEFEENFGNNLTFAAENPEKTANNPKEIKRG